MKQQLEALGWRLYHECSSCGGGGVKQHFDHPDKPGYEIVSLSKTKTFRIFLNNQLVAGPFWAYQLDDKIKQHVS